MTSAKASFADQSAPKTARTVLIIGDDAPARTAWSKLLRAEGFYTLITASDAGARGFLQAFQVDAAILIGLRASSPSNWTRLCTLAGQKVPLLVVSTEVAQLSSRLEQLQHLMGAC